MRSKSILFLVLFSLPIVAKDVVFFGNSDKPISLKPNLAAGKFIATANSNFRLSSQRDCRSIYADLRREFIEPLRKIPVYFSFFLSCKSPKGKPNLLSAYIYAQALTAKDNATLEKYRQKAETTRVFKYSPKYHPVLGVMMYADFEAYQSQRGSSRTTFSDRRVKRFFKNFWDFDKFILDTRTKLLAKKPDKLVKMYEGFFGINLAKALNTNVLPKADKFRILFDGSIVYKHGDIVRVVFPRRWPVAVRRCENSSTTKCDGKLP